MNATTNNNAASADTAEKAAPEATKATTTARKTPAAKKAPAKKATAIAAAARQKAEEKKSGKRPVNSQKALGINLSADDKLKTLVKENPKRQGTDAHRRFGMLQRYNGKTIGELSKAWAKAREQGEKWATIPPKAEITWCLARGFVEIPGKEIKK